jgi:Glycine-rich protein domain (DUF2403)
VCITPTPVQRIGDGFCLLICNLSFCWEKLSVHFRGPVHLKQFAVYAPPSAGKSKQAALIRRAPPHTAYVPSPGYILEQLTRQIIPTRIDGRDVVLFRDLGIVEPSGTASSSSSARGSYSGASSTTCAAQAVAAATTHGKLWSWINSSFNKSRVATSGVKGEDTVSGQNVMARVKNWFDHLSLFSTDPASTSASTERLNARMGLGTDYACTISQSF